MGHFNARWAMGLTASAVFFVSMLGGCMSHSLRKVHVASPPEALESKAVGGTYEDVGYTEAEARGNVYFCVTAIDFPDKAVVQPWVVDSPHATCTKRKPSGFVRGLKSLCRILHLPFFAGSRLVDAACYNALHNFSPPADILYNPTIEVKKLNLLLYTQIVAVVRGKALRLHVSRVPTAAEVEVGDESLNW